MQPTGGNDDADDIVVHMTSMTASLRDMYTFKRIVSPVRYEKCKHLGAFDLDTFLEGNRQSLKWQCPMCDCAGPPTCLRRDTYLAAILDLLAATVTAEDGQVMEVSIEATGAWRAHHPNNRSRMGRLVSPEETASYAYGVMRPATFPHPMFGDVNTGVEV